MFKYRRIDLFLVLLLFCLFILSACGPSPEELAATSAAETAAAATKTPKPTTTPTFTPTPTQTPVPYDLSVLITGEGELPIQGAIVVIAEAYKGKASSRYSDDVGQAFWYDLPGETVNLSINAQGYFLKETSEIITRGINQVIVNLERDPHGLLAAEVCGPGQKPLYIEDFQDGEAQGWSETIKFGAMGWYIIPHPDSQGNLVLSKSGDYGGGGVELENISFGNAVWHIQFMKTGNLVNRFEWHKKHDYIDETGIVNFSTYWAAFENPPWNFLAIHRDKDTSSVPLFSKTGFLIKKGEWYQVDMGTFEGRFDLWLNDRVIVSFKDPAPLPAGLIGISLFDVVDPEQIIYFDNIVVCELTEPYQPLPTP